MLLMEAQQRLNQILRDEWKLNNVTYQRDCAWAIDLNADFLNEAVPEVLALKIGNAGGIHKDIYEHTLQVVRNVPDVRDQDNIPYLRLAALLHDIAKPATRQIADDGTVTFYGHDILGERMARKRLGALGYSNEVIDKIGLLIRMHVRWYEPSWTDGGIRRFVREAGSQFNDLMALMEADNTGTDPKYRNLYKALHKEFLARVERLKAQEKLDAMRPALNGNEVMEYLGIEPGALVGAIMKMLMEVRLEDGEISKEEAYRRIDAMMLRRVNS